MCDMHMNTTYIHICVKFEAFRTYALDYFYLNDKYMSDIWRKKCYMVIKLAPWMATVINMVFEEIQKDVKNTVSSKMIIKQSKK